MKRYEGKLAGILGTVIIHLLAAILFVSVRLNSLERDKLAEYILVLVEPETDASEKEIDLPSISDPLQSDVDTRIRNLIRNMADQTDPVIDPAEYQDRVKDEMIRQGLLNEDNFIDDWRNRVMNEDGAVEMAEIIKEQKKSDEQKPVNYQGPTRVYYSLEGRYHRHLPVPVYKCEGAGKVTVSIDVDQNGMVTEARVVAAESSTTELCLIETAVNSALISLFNISPGSPKKQTGTITFHFVAQ
jgi:hypothetical protein